MNVELNQTVLLDSEKPWSQRNQGRLRRLAGLVIGKPAENIGRRPDGFEPREREIEVRYGAESLTRTLRSRGIATADVALTFRGDGTKAPYYVYAARKKFPDGGEAPDANWSLVVTSSEGVMTRFVLEEKPDDDMGVAVTAGPVDPRKVNELYAPQEWNEELHIHKTTARILHELKHNLVRDEPSICVVAPFAQPAA